MLFLEKDKTLFLPFLTSVTKLLHPQLFNLISSFNLIFGDNFYGDVLSKSGKKELGNPAGVGIYSHSATSGRSRLPPVTTSTGG